MRQTNLPYTVEEIYKAFRVPLHVFAHTSVKHAVLFPVKELNQQTDKAKIKICP